jgi:hypothetical protein
MAWIKLNATDPAAPAGARNVHFRQESGHSGLQADPIPTSAFLEDIFRLGGVDARTGAAESISADSLGKLVTLGNADPTVVSLGDDTLSRSGWSISATYEYGANPPTLAIDADPETYWWTGAEVPQSLIIDLGAEQTFNAVGLRSAPTSDRCRAFSVYVSDDGINWGDAIGSASWPDADNAYHSASFASETRRYVKITVTTGEGGTWAQVSDAQLYCTDDSFVCAVRALGAGGATLIPLAGTINGEASLALAEGEDGWLWFDGVNWHALLGGGGGEATINFVDGEAPTDSGDHTNFTLAHSPSPASSLQLFRNGLLQHAGEGNDYVLAGTDLTLAVALDAGDSLSAWYRY